MLCHRGCGLKATYTNYKKLPCCYKHQSKCPAVKSKIGAKNSLALQGKKLTEEHKAKISSGLKKSARVYSEHTIETKQKISKSKKGSIPWNKGLTGVQSAWNKGLKKQEPLEILSREDEAYRDFKKYRNRVSVRTRKTYEIFKEEINPNNYVLGKAGVVGAYQIDHIVSVREGFEKNIPIETISSKDNLQIIPWLENVKKYDGSRTMSNRLVICSSPVDDNYVGEKYNADFCNIDELSLEQLKQKIQNYAEIIFEHNCSNKDALFKLQTIANLTGHTAPSADNSFYINRTQDKKFNSDQILYIGCSHTHGVGHSTQQTVYTNILSKMLNKVPVVDAHFGRGNWLTEEKLQTYDLKNTSVILQFTDIYRLRLNGIDVRGQDFTKEQSAVFSDEVLASIFLNIVKRSVNLLRANNTKFCFFQISHEYPLHQEVVSRLSTYKEFVYIENANLDTGDLGNHMGVISHTHWAEEIYKRFTALYM